MKRVNPSTAVSVTLMSIGVIFTLGAALYGTSYVLASYTSANTRYLESHIKPTLGVYNTLPTPTRPSSSQVPAFDENPVSGEDVSVAAESLVLPLVDAAGDSETPHTPEATEPEIRAEGQETALQQTPTPTRVVTEVDPYELGPPPTITPTPTPTFTPSPTPTVTPTPSATPTQEPPPPEPGEPSQPIVRLKIPSISVERTVVEIGVDPEKGWDTDSLFATKNRPDLVGHLQGSALPGEGSNIVLAGHNYDWGIFQWNGVFYNLKQLKAGDKIAAFTQGGEKHIYVVEKVKEIPFNGGNADELFKHAKHLGPTETERLTLVTCSGANLLNWNKRVYVIASPQN